MYEMSWVDVPFSLSAAGLVAWVGKTMFASLKLSKWEVPVEGQLQQCQKYLLNNEYEIVHSREVVSWDLEIDKDCYSEQILVDFIVRRDGIYYAVMVRRSSDEALGGQKLLSKFQTAAILCGVVDVLYVDIEEEVAHKIKIVQHFAKRVRRRRMIHRGLWFGAGILSAVAWMHRT